MSNPDEECDVEVRVVLKAFVSPEKRKSQITIPDLEAELAKTRPIGA